MKKTQLTTEEILKSGKFPAITTTEEFEDDIKKTTTFKLDKINAITLTTNEKIASANYVTIQMDGRKKNLLFEFDDRKEAKEFYEYVMERW